MSELMLSERPYDPKSLRKKLGAQAWEGKTFPASNGTKRKVNEAIDNLFPDDPPWIREQRRHRILRFLTGRRTTEKIMNAWAIALLHWASDFVCKNDSGGNVYRPSAIAAKEAALVDAMQLEKQRSEKSAEAKRLQLWLEAGGDK